MIDTSPSPARRRWIWFIITLAVLGIALIPAPNPSEPPAEHHLRVEASSFNYSPAILRVNQGDRVTLELASTDVVHGIYIDGYKIQVSADPGQPQSLSFIADRPGVYRFRCSVTCGAMHPFMIGKLYVGPNWLLVKVLGIAVLVVFASFWSLRK